MDACLRLVRAFRDNKPHNAHRQEDDDADEEYGHRRRHGGRGEQTQSAGDAAPLVPTSRPSVSPYMEIMLL